MFFLFNTKPKIPIKNNNIEKFILNINVIPLGTVNNICLLTIINEAVCAFSRLINSLNKIKKLRRD